MREPVSTNTSHSPKGGAGRGLPLGLRNNNPPNIRRGKSRWQGEVLPQRGNRLLGAERLGSASDGGQGGEGAFCRFEDLSWGIRAAFCILRTYRDKYKAVCIEDIITRWAPPTENDTRKYISDLCRLTGFGGKERLTENDWPKLVKQMALLESGAVLSEDVIRKGFALFKG